MKANCAIARIKLFLKGKCKQCIAISDVYTDTFFTGEYILFIRNCHHLHYCQFDACKTQHITIFFKNGVQGYIIYYIPVSQIQKIIYIFKESHTIYWVYML